MIRLPRSPRGFAQYQVHREVFAALLYFCLDPEKKEGWGIVPSELSTRRDRGPGGKGRATDLRTGRRPIALGVQPLAPSQPVPAVPCHTPAPLHGLCHTFPCSSALLALSVATSRKVPAATAAALQHKLRSEELDLAALGSRVALGCDATSPLPAARGVTLHLGETRRDVGLSVQTDSRSSRLSITVLLPAYISNRYVLGSLGSLVPQSQSPGRQSSIVSPAFSVTSP